MIIKVGQSIVFCESGYGFFGWGDKKKFTGVVERIEKIDGTTFITLLERGVIPHTFTRYGLEKAMREAGSWKSVIEKRDEIML